MKAGYQKINIICGKLGIAKSFTLIKTIRCINNGKFHFNLFIVLWLKDTYLPGLQILYVTNRWRCYKLC